MMARWVKGDSRMGFTPVYVVDEHGCLLNTEPACSVPDRYGDWFMAWLLSQPCLYPTTPELLEHHPAFPSVEQQALIDGLAERPTY